MNDHEALIIAGLVLDIAGIVLLFAVTTSSAIEREIASRLMRAMLDNAQGREWVGDRSYKELESEQKAAEKSVRLQVCLQRAALALLFLGFSLQIWGQAIQP